MTPPPTHSTLVARGEPVAQHFKKVDANLGSSFDARRPRMNVSSALFGVWDCALR